MPVSKLAAHYALELSRLQAGLYPKDTYVESRRCCAHLGRALIRCETLLCSSAGGAGTQRGKREAAVDARKRLHAHVSKGTAEELDSCRQVVIRVRRNRLGRVNDTKSTKPRTGRCHMLGRASNGAQCFYYTCKCADDISDSATYNNGLRPKCPICLSYVDGDDAGVNFHIDACLQREVSRLYRTVSVLMLNCGSLSCLPGRAHQLWGRYSAGRCVSIHLLIILQQL